jgi:6-pyruvoyltetrahydropterin/6-carboxytetrahydropterin synthase
MYQSTKIIELGSCAFRQPKAKSHCRHLHGYRLVSKIWFDCETLDENNWVMDFGGLKDLKTILEANFDHVLVIADNDPHVDLFKQVAAADAAKLLILKNGVGIERFAEHVYNLSNDFVKEKTNNRVWVSKVEVWEHDKNSAIFSEPKSGGCCKKEKKVEVKEEKAVPIEEIKLEVAPAPQTNPDPYAARVGNKVSSGWSNPFAGTSWGT